MSYKERLFELFPKAKTKDIERIVQTSCCTDLFDGVKKCNGGTCTECWNRKVEKNDAI